MLAKAERARRLDAHNLGVIVRFLPFQAVIQ